MNARSTAIAMVSGVSLALFMGCAANAKDQHAQSILPEIDVVQVKENSDEALKIAQQAKLDIEVINTKLTELDNKIVLLSEQISEVSIAKIEELETRLSLLIEAYKDLQAQVNTGAGSSGAVGKTVNLAAGPRPGFSPAGSANILKTSSEYDAYQNALRVFSTRKYDQAVKMFADILAAYPSGTYADNCQFWMGECYYALGDYAAAVNGFKKVFAYSNSSKADDAQLKIGLCYLKMGQYGPAKQELQVLIDRYPASEYVQRAQKYLTEMK